MKKIILILFMISILFVPLDITSSAENSDVGAVEYEDEYNPQKDKENANDILITEEEAEILAQSEKEEENISEKVEEKEENPETGVEIAIIPLVIALIILIVLGVMKRIKNKK